MAGQRAKARAAALGVDMAEDAFVRLEAIAGFFGVAPRYLFDDEQADAVDEDIQTALALKDLEVQGLHLRQLQELTPNRSASSPA